MLGKERSGWHCQEEISAHLITLRRMLRNFGCPHEPSFLIASDMCKLPLDKQSPMQMTMLRSRVQPELWLKRYKHSCTELVIGPGDWVHCWALEFSGEIFNIFNACPPIWVSDLIGLGWLRPYIVLKLLERFQCTARVENHWRRPKLSFKLWERNGARQEGTMAYDFVCQLQPT